MQQKLILHQAARALLKNLLILSQALVVEAGHDHKVQDQVVVIVTLRERVGPPRRIEGIFYLSVYYQLKSDLIFQVMFVCIYQKSDVH